MCVIKGKDDKDALRWYSLVFNKFQNINKMVDSYIKRTSVPENIYGRESAMSMAKIPLLTFAGNIRNYPRFKRDFRNKVLPNVKDSEAPFTLRQWLSESIRN